MSAAEQHPLISREVLDRLHGEGCECPVHRPDLYEPKDKEDK